MGEQLASRCMFNLFILVMFRNLLTGHSMPIRPRKTYISQFSVTLIGTTGIRGQGDW